MASNGSPVDNSHAEADLNRMAALLHVLTGRYLRCVANNCRCWQPTAETMVPTGPENGRVSFSRSLSRDSNVDIDVVVSDEPMPPVASPPPSPTVQDVLEKCVTEVCQILVEEVTAPPSPLLAQPVLLLERTPIPDRVALRPRPTRQPKRLVLKPIAISSGRKQNCTPKKRPTKKVTKMPFPPKGVTYSTITFTPTRKPLVTTDDIVALDVIPASPVPAPASTPPQEHVSLASLYDSFDSFETAADCSCDSDRSLVGLSTPNE